MSLKISIITITYNRASTIETAIQSVLSQNYPDIEYIIVDGASKDGTQEIIDRYAGKIHKYLSEPDKGMYNALNKAIRMATGDVVGILHSDDMFFSEETIAQYARAFEDTKADVVYANGVYIPLNTGNKNETVRRVYKAAPFRKWYLNFGWIPLHTTIFVRREVFDKYGLYEESYTIASDYEISQRWFRQPELKKVFMNRWVVKMRLGGKSTNATLQKRKSDEDMRVIRQYKMWGYFTLICKIGQKIPQYIKPRLGWVKL